LGGAASAALLATTETTLIPVVIGASIAGIAIARQWRISLMSTAREIEASERTLDNLVVTAAELHVQPRPVSAEIRDAISRQAERKIATVDPARVVPLAQPAGVAAAVIIGCARRRRHLCADRVAGLYRTAHRDAHRSRASDNHRRQPGAY
jgi:hypothetical protein